MNAPADFVTVYRSMDATAKEDCEIIIDMLKTEGISSVMLDDSAPGVPEGVFEVQVAAQDVAAAERLVDENPLPDDVEEVDDSANLDLETIFQASGTIAEVEAIGMKNVLEANGIAVVVIGNSVLPTNSFEVRVAHDQVERARDLIAEAQKAGPAAAEEAELASEAGTTGERSAPGV